MSDIEKSPTVDDLLDLSDVVPAVKTVVKARDFAKKVAKVRLDRWWKGLVKDSEGKTPQEVQGLIEAKIHDSRQAKETVWAAAKEILDAISDEACEVIGSLTAEYLRNEGGPDAFFRGAIRVLADLGTNELDVLRKIAVFGSRAGAGSERITLIPTSYDGTLSVKIDDLADPHASIEPGSRLEVHRVTRLLKSNDLCIEVLVLNGGPTAMVWEVPVLEKLRDHLG